MLQVTSPGPPPIQLRETQRQASANRVDKTSLNRGPVLGHARESLSGPFLDRERWFARPPLPALPFINWMTRGSLHARNGNTWRLGFTVTVSGPSVEPRETNNVDCRDHLSAPVNTK
jgi:hypothetical protein